MSFVIKIFTSYALRWANVYVPFRKCIPTFHARVATFYIKTWFLLDLIMVVKKIKSCPIGQ